MMHRSAHSATSTPPAGFTLIETVIAIGIILFGLVSILTLATSSRVAQRATSGEFVAANLAREAIEIVRAQRDSNWLAYDSDNTTVWNSGLLDGLDYSAVITQRDPQVSAWLAFAPNAFGDTCPGRSGTQYDCSAVWLDTTTQTYFQTTWALFQAKDYTKTAFSRLVQLYPICRNTAAASGESDEQIPQTDCSTLGSAYQQVGIDVVAVVQWTGNDQPTTYTVEEHLYDWK